MPKKFQVSDETIERLLEAVITDPEVMYSSLDYAQYWMEREGADFDNTEQTGTYQTLYNTMVLTRMLTLLTQS